jgi:hypothetical protein
MPATEGLRPQQKSKSSIPCVRQEEEEEETKGKHSIMKMLGVGYNSSNVIAARV